MNFRVTLTDHSVEDYLDIEANVSYYIAVEDGHLLVYRDTKIMAIYTPSSWIKAVKI